MKVKVTVSQLVVYGYVERYCHKEYTGEICNSFSIGYRYGFF